MAAAAYNLGVVLGKKNLDEAIAWCRKAHELAPDDPKYAHTLAFFLRAKGDAAEAVEILRRFVERGTPSVEIHLLLAAIYEDRGARPAAMAVYQRALALPGLSPSVERNSRRRPKPEAVRAGSVNHRRPSGWGGIRTPGTRTRTAVFKTAALDHSATHPNPGISRGLLTFLPSGGLVSGHV